MLFSLGYESELRRCYRFPRALPLWGKDARCLWRRRTGPTDGEIRELERSPNVAFERLRLIGLQRVALLDELLAHAKFGAAMNLAGYLAAIPALDTRGTGRGDFDVEVLAFLRLKEAQAAIEGGYYTRARALMVQLDALTRALPAGYASDLVHANVAMLWGRLLQLLWLLRKSKEFLKEARAAFSAVKNCVPAGFHLLELRSDLPHLGPQESVTKTLERGRDAEAGIFGGLGNHYARYLFGQIALERGQWKTAEQLLRTAITALTHHGHRGVPDPIRLAYSTLALGQAIAGEGHEDNNASRVDEGLRLILQAQWQFEHENNEHGQYLAHRGYSKASEPIHDEDETRIRALKSVYGLSVRSQVPRFQLESGLAYANELYRYGRPNRVSVLIAELKHIAADPLAEDLTKGTDWTKLLSFERKTSVARDNGVTPLADWGISPYAQEEGAYVRSAAKSDLLVTVFGPPGSGRRVLIARIAAARSEQAPIALDARTRSSILSDIEKHRSSNAPLILHNIDLWEERAQIDVLDTVRGTNKWPVSIYLTLRQTSARDSELGDRQHPHLSKDILECALEIKPLSMRKEDTLLLARGFLVRALAERNKGKRRSFDPKTIVFTSAACQYIRERYKDVRTLSRHMRDLARSLKDRDFILTSDNRRRIPLEVIRKHLDVAAPTQPAASADVTPKNEPPRLGFLKVNLLTASESEITAVSRDFKGKLAKAAREHQVPASTFRKSLRDRDLIAAWESGRPKPHSN